LALGALVVVGDVFALYIAAVGHALNKAGAAVVQRRMVGKLREADDHAAFGVCAIAGVIAGRTGGKGEECEHGGKRQSEQTMRSEHKNTLLNTRIAQRFWRGKHQIQKTLAAFCLIWRQPLLVSL